MGQPCKRYMGPLCKVPCTGTWDSHVNRYVPVHGTAMYWYMGQPCKQPCTGTWDSHVNRHVPVMYRYTAIYMAVACTGSWVSHVPIVASILKKLSRIKGKSFGKKWKSRKLALEKNEEISFIFFFEGFFAQCCMGQPCKEPCTVHGTAM